VTSQSHPAVRLKRGIERLPNSKSLYGEIMRAARLGMNLVGTSVADERAFFVHDLHKETTCGHVCRKA
jgi:hypothetical protein